MNTPEKLSFSSNFRYERAVNKGHFDFSIPVWGSNLYTLPHNLGYVPFFKLFYGFGDGRIFGMFAGASSYGLAGNTAQVDDIYADANNIYVRISDGNGSSFSGTVYYRIYAEVIA